MYDVYKPTIMKRTVEGGDKQEAYILMQPSSYTILAKDETFDLIPYQDTLLTSADIWKFENDKFGIIYVCFKIDI